MAGMILPMSMTRKMLIRCFTSVLVLLGPAAGQQMAVGLGSPNTRDSMSYADAKASLRSFEETNFVVVADRIVCALAPRGSTGLSPSASRPIPIRRCQRNCGRVNGATRSRGRARQPNEADLPAHRQERLCHTSRWTFKPMLARVSVSDDAVLSAPAKFCARKEKSRPSVSPWAWPRT